MTVSRVCPPPLSRWRQLGCIGAALLARAAIAGALPPSALPSALPDSVQQALQAAEVPPTSVSMLVIPVDGGLPRLSHQADTVRSVASVMKLFTTGVALQALGPAFTWHTQAALGGRLRPNGTLDGPLLIRGDGDPSLTPERLALMMTRWRAAGLRDIHGDMLLDRSAFVLPDHDPSAFDEQPLKPHNAGPDALLVSYQAVTLRLRPDVARPGWAQVSMEPELSGVRLDAKVPLDEQAACRDWRESMTLDLRPDPKVNHGWTMTLKGRYPRACAERDWPVHWPGGAHQDHTERVLDMAWRRAGGVLKGQIHGLSTVGGWPANVAPWISWESPPLANVVRDINKYSNNVMARQLFLTLGREAFVATDTAPIGPMGPGTLEGARIRVARQVVQATTDAANGYSPCAADALVLDNGSGLSRTERASAACVGRWLQALWASPVMPELLASLPVSGVDGTARKMNTVAGRAHIKTGSLDGTIALAGVALGDSGHRYVVVGVVNDAKASAARPALEALLNWTVHDR
ncbi:MAG: D-alanyl-D-alanine carboxypeptidase/D-alanyl-D-alanine-endopeptidase [Burkholderiales bacterium]|nr:D-alanyl-D-alanine carboxypeptidase/D-alanyl-D-alanine-endopeptidase [Burkholderiales bacterium]